MTNNEKSKKIAEAVKRKIATGTLNAANKIRAFVVGKIKEELSVAALRRAVRGVLEPGKKKGAILFYRATTPATPNAPPRLLSGELRRRFMGKVFKTDTRIGGVRILLGSNARAFPTKKYPQGYKYPEHHEVKDPKHPTSGKHQYIKPVLRRLKTEINQMLTNSIAEALKK